MRRRNASQTGALGGDLAGKPIDRALLDGFAELCLGGGGPVYDLGCGPGHVTRYLAERGLDAHGLGLAPEMVRIARARYPALGRVRVPSAPPHKPRIS